VFGVCLLVMESEGGVHVKIYISHSVGCAGWDMEGIYKGTLFQTGCRTTRFKDKDIGHVKMLDWDYLEWKKQPAKIEALHLKLVKDNDFDVVMSMDLWSHNRFTALCYADKLMKYANRVLIPVHDYPQEVKDYDLAYPNANWFAKNTFPPGEFRGSISHILGGSPQSQIKHLTTTQIDLRGFPCKLPNIESIDGNQIFNVAIRAGKEWFPDKPYWRKPREKLSNEQIFKNSVKKLSLTIELF